MGDMSTRRQSSTPISLHASNDDRSFANQRRTPTGRTSCKRLVSTMIALAIIGTMGTFWFGRHSMPSLNTPRINQAARLHEPAPLKDAAKMAKMQVNLRVQAEALRQQTSYAAEQKALIDQLQAELLQEKSSRSISGQQAVKTATSGQKVEASSPAAVVTHLVGAAPVTNMSSSEVKADPVEILDDNVSAVEKEGTQGEGQGVLANAMNQTQDAAPDAGRQQNSTASSETLPAGTYAESCKECQIIVATQNMLRCQCKNEEGEFQTAEVIVGVCPSFGNLAGALVCDSSAHTKIVQDTKAVSVDTVQDTKPAIVEHTPTDLEKAASLMVKGDYADSCMDCVRVAQKTRIRCTCKTASGDDLTTELDLVGCVNGKLSNSDGRLACKDPTAGPKAHVHIDSSTDGHALNVEHLSLREKKSFQLAIVMNFFDKQIDDLLANLDTWSTRSPCASADYEEGSLPGVSTVVFYRDTPWSRHNGRSLRNKILLKWKELQNNVQFKTCPHTAGEPLFLDGHGGDGELSYPDLPCEKFYEAFSKLERVDLGNGTVGFDFWMNMEPDLRPIRAGWGDALQSECHTDGFPLTPHVWWQKGSLARCHIGKAAYTVSGHHMNGGALYRLKAPQFDRYRQLVQSFYRPPDFGKAAGCYGTHHHNQDSFQGDDLAMYWYRHDNANYNYGRLVADRFVLVDTVMNMCKEDYIVESFAQDHPRAYLVHSSGQDQIPNKLGVEKPAGGWRTLSSKQPEGRPNRDVAKAVTPEKNRHQKLAFCKAHIFQPQPSNDLQVRGPQFDHIFIRVSLDTTENQQSNRARIKEVMASMSIPDTKYTFLQHKGTLAALLEQSHPFLKDIPQEGCCWSKSMAGDDTYNDDGMGQPLHGCTAAKCKKLREAASTLHALSQLAQSEHRHAMVLSDDIEDANLDAMQPPAKGWAILKLQGCALNNRATPSTLVKAFGWHLAQHYPDFGDGAFAYTREAASWLLKHASPGMISLGHIDMQISSILQQKSEDQLPPGGYKESCGKCSLQTEVARKSLVGVLSCSCKGAVEGQRSTTKVVLHGCKRDGFVNKDGRLACTCDSVIAKGTAATWSKEFAGQAWPSNTFLRPTRYWFTSRVCPATSEIYIDA